MNNQKSAKIVVAYHKQWPVCKDSVYLPIQVGARQSTMDLGLQRDDEGDNISIMNPYYSEVTALYYLWKNIQAEYKGLSHYRRYFCFNRETTASKFLSSVIEHVVNIVGFFIKNVRYTNQHYVFLRYDGFVNKINSEEKLMFDVLEESSIIAPIPTQITSTVRDHFIRIIGREPIARLDEMMEKNHLNKVYSEMMRSSAYYSANMSIMKTDIFNEYCSFLFPLLEEHLDALLSRNKLSNDYLRVSGYISEILTSTFIMSKEGIENIYKTPVYYVDEFKNLTRLGSFGVSRGFFHPMLIKK